MYTVFILGTIVAIISLVIFYERGDFRENSLIASIGFVIGMFIGFIISLIIGTEYKHVKEYEHEIVSLQDNKAIESYFLYGANSTMEYTFYVKDGEYFKMETLPYSDVKIKYSSGKPRVVYYKYLPTDNIINDWGTSFTQPSYYNFYVIYVPKGTIKTDFELNAQ